MEFAKSPNYTQGRGGNSIQYIIIHWFGMGTIDGAISSFQNPSREASAHYLISNSRIVQMVDEKDTAWHCGVYSMNQKSIGIENDANPDKPLTEEGYKTVAKLVREICDRYGLSIDREHIKGHREIKPTQCPGTIDLDKIIILAKGDQMNEQELRAIFSNVVNGFYINYYLRTPNQIELNNHVNAIYADYVVRKQNNNHPEWALSEWVNRQAKEAEFKQKWINPTACPKTVCPPCPPCDCTAQVTKAVADKQLEIRKALGINA